MVLAKKGNPGRQVPTADAGHDAAHFLVGLNHAGGGDFGGRHIFRREDVGRGQQIAAVGNQGRVIRIRSQLFG